MARPTRWHQLGVWGFLAIHQGSLYTLYVSGKHSLLFPGQCRTRKLYCHAHSQELAQYWLEKYQWKKAEAGLNSFANYEMLCNGIETHFIHERSIDPHAIPLLMVHGWPGALQWQ